MPDHSYLVTARKYRPQRFHEIAAQEHVTETLKNAICLDRLAHAYLFSGPRGVGKTTAARILAKAINCTTPLAERDQGEPCRSCPSCTTFEEGRSLSIIEIDAASNNRVEDIRDLRETILIPPQGSRKKVYIIDEVHMLSNAAFNALLKTLEEPPSHALFIFATTEPNKVLPTILSRCQRFDFRRIPVAETVKHLEVICQAEGVDADEASLLLIAHKGDGALRDALSAFDQAVSLCGSSLTYTELAKAFGVVGVELFFEVTDCISKGDSAGLLLLVERILSQGYDLQEFLVGLSAHLRNLIVARTMPDTALIEAAESVKTLYAETSAQFSEADLLRLLMVVADGEEVLKTSVQPRLQLELTLLKMSAMAHAVDLREALKKLESLEKQVQQGQREELRPSSQPAPASPSTSSPRDTQQSDAQKDTLARGQSISEGSSAPVLPLSAARDRERFPSSEGPAAGSIRTEAALSHPAIPQMEHEAAQDPGTDPGESKTSRGTAAEKPAMANPPQQAEMGRGASAGKTPREQYESLYGAPALRKVQMKPKETRAPASAAALRDEVLVTEAAASKDVDWVRGVWTSYLHHVKSERIHVSALLQHAAPLDVRDGTLVLSVPDEFHKRMLASQNEFLVDNLMQFVSLPIQRLSFVIDLARAEEKAAHDASKHIDPHEYMRQKRQENPVIRAIFEEFGGEMVW